MTNRKFSLEGKKKKRKKRETKKRRNRKKKKKKMVDGFREDQEKPVFHWKVG